ncbi:MAG: 3-methylitaconate isomerase [Peptococcaceae bacterium]|jgi:2-methylaconitate cis-trans-isomerase PrpF|nr:3-methylitaconate isomerase [Peptococcaceae bacterium]
MNPQMTPYRAVIHRGGTSKAIFLMENELPKDQEQRDKVIRAIFGSPDKRQIDGLGGADVLTSKLAVIGPSRRAGADVEYTFAQVSFDSELVDYSGNCGNISAAVGPFAIDEGLVPAVEPVTRVRIYQTNTDCILIAEVEVADGKSKTEGTTEIDGVPGAGSPIMLDFSDTVGSTTGKLLPTGHTKDQIDVEGFGAFTVSIVDAGNVVIFIEAGSLGLSGAESSAELEADKALLDKIEAIRSTVCVKIGLCKSREEATKYHAYAPFFAIVSKPARYVSESKGNTVTERDVDITARLLFMLHVHKTYPGTGSVATGAAARVPGTLVYEQLNEDAKSRIPLRIGHPGGVMVIEASASAKRDTGTAGTGTAGTAGTGAADSANTPFFERLAYVRTARRLMEGTAYVKNSVLQ